MNITLQTLCIYVIDTRTGVSKIYPIWVTTMSLVGKACQRRIKENVFIKNKRLLDTLCVSIREYPTLIDIRYVSDTDTF